MSKQNNVNPGQYKVAGRERPGKDIPEPQRSPGLGRANDQSEGRKRGGRQAEKQGSSSRRSKT